MYKHSYIYSCTYVRFSHVNLLTIKKISSLPLSALIFTVIFFHLLNFYILSDRNSLGSLFDHNKELGASEDKRQKRANKCPRD